MSTKGDLYFVRRKIEIKMTEDDREYFYHEIPAFLNKEGVAIHPEWGPGEEGKLQPNKRRWKVTLVKIPAFLNKEGVAQGMCFPEVFATKKEARLFAIDVIRARQEASKDQ